MLTMRAAVFRGKDKLVLEDRPVPQPGPGEAVIRLTLTTVCGTDVHIWKGEYPVEEGRILGHEPVGVIHELGEGLTGYEIGDRVLVGAITPCGTCTRCQEGQGAQCQGYEGRRSAGGGWRFGNTHDGVQADYALVPFAQANLAKIPADLADEDVVLLADIASTGFSAIEKAPVRLGDTVAVFAQGPIGLCATAGARLAGASLVVGVDPNPVRQEIALRMGADLTIDPTSQDAVQELRRLTGGGVDVAVEALGRQETFEAGLRSLRPGGTLSSLGVYAGDLRIPVEPFAAGLGDHRIVTTLCPGGKSRMQQLISLVRSGRLSVRSLLTHEFALDDITEAYPFFAEQQDGVLKVAIRPSKARAGGPSRRLKTKVHPG
jgi:alcohol dehydrogenase